MILRSLPLGLRADGFGHIASECTRGEKRKRERNDKGGQKPKKGKKEQVNQTAEKETTNTLIFSADDEAYNFDTYNSVDANENDDRLLWYDWLVDSCTTSHVANRRRHVYHLSTYEKIG
jgi:hypothetical protein